MSAEAPIDLHKVNGDSRKMIAVRHLMKKYPKAIEYWKDSGATERVSGEVRHKHGVLGHQFSGGIFADEITSWLEEKGLLNRNQVSEVVLATLIHDADKPTDMAFIIMAMGGREQKDEVSWANVETIINGTDLSNKEQVVDDLKTNYEKYFNGDVSLGDRVHVARAMVAGRIHKDRLKAAGFSDTVIEIQAATEYTGCDEVDYLIDQYAGLTPEEQKLALQKIVINYIDNGMMESELVDVEKRTDAVFKKPINIALSIDYAKWNDKGETAEVKQVRVGRKVEAFLANMVGVEPSEFLPFLNARVQDNLSSV